MRNLIGVLIGLAALAFVLAVLATLFGLNIMNVAAEAFSRASTNLALLAIALSLVSGKKV
jgi:hypothetical protein